MLKVTPVEAPFAALRWSELHHHAFLMTDAEAKFLPAKIVRPNMPVLRLAVNWCWDVCAVKHARVVAVSEWSVTQDLRVLLAENGETGVTRCLELSSGRSGFDVIVATERLLEQVVEKFWPQCFVFIIIFEENGAAEISLDDIVHEHDGLVEIAPNVCCALSLYRHADSALLITRLDIRTPDF